jgi:glycosyltransferase involved in cell wall biosynthesis
MMIELSVVMISRDQAWNVSRLIESVLRGTRKVSSRQVVLVDSASTDGTAEVGARYPIGVLRLHQQQPLTPAAGRYTGFRNTEGDLILFLDGDMELVDGWLEMALETLEARPDAAVVTGTVVDLPKDAANGGKPALPPKGSDVVCDAPYAGGAAVYRRQVLEEIGPFNPYLYSDEEPELCVRIRHAGHRVVRLSYPIAYHYTDPRDGLSTQVGRWRRKLYLGAGQSLRYHLGGKLFWPYARLRGYGLVSGTVVLLMVLSLLAALLTGHAAAWALVWGALFALLIAGDAFRKRSLYQTVSSLLKQALILDGTIRGFLLTPRDPSTYPESFELIREVNALRGHLGPAWRP